jgi:hypothetical protein
MHGDPLPWGYLGLIDHRPKGGCETATQTCGGHEVYLYGQRHKVNVCAPHGYKLGERSPVGETGLKLAVANLLIS